MSVSRETGDLPEVAKSLFAVDPERARRFARLLATDGVKRGLIGPREVARLWDRHLLNCAVLEIGIPTDSRVCDVGSGAGLPGIVISLVRPDLNVVLLEPLLRRWTFLSEVIESLDLGGRVWAVRERAEEHEGRYDVVTARAVAPMLRLLNLCLPLCLPGGTVLAMKGQRAEAELEAAVPELRRRHVASWSVERYGGDVVEPPTTVVRIVT